MANEEHINASGEKNEVNIGYISVNSIDYNPSQPRQRFDHVELMELSESIREHGIIQPIVVRKDGERFVLVVGERRYRAAKMAGLSEVPAIIKDIDDKQASVMTVVENIQRKDLNPIEEAMAFKELMEKFGLTQEDVAKLVGKGRPTIANILRLLELPNKIQDEVMKEHLTMGHARALLSLNDPQIQEAISQQIQKEHLSVRQAERLIQDVLLGKVEPEASQIEEPKNKKKITQKIRDARIFLNTIRRAVKEVVKAGAQIETQENETEEYIEIIIRIPKQETTSVSEQ